MVADAVGGIAGKQIGFLHVVTSDPLFPGVKDNGYGRIAYHAAAVCVQKLPPLEYL